MQLLWYFWIYSFLGWILERAYAFLVQSGRPDMSFGEGWVIAAEPFDRDWMATILFDRYSQKQIACALARLERI